MLTLAPTKPVGAFMTKEEADALIAKGIVVKEDAGRGYRTIVPYGLYIDGKWVPASDGATLKVINPATGQIML